MPTILSIIFLFLSTSIADNAIAYSVNESTSVITHEGRSDGAWRSRFIENKLSKIHYMNEKIVMDIYFRMKYEKPNSKRKQFYRSTLKILKTKMEKTSKKYWTVVSKELSKKEVNDYLRSMPKLLLSYDQLGELYNRDVKANAQSYPPHDDMPSLPGHGACHSIGEMIFDDCICSVDVGSKCSDFEIYGVDSDVYEALRRIKCMQDAIIQENACLRRQAMPDAFQDSPYVMPIANQCEEMRANCHKAEFPSDPPPEVPTGPFPENNPFNF